MYEYDLPCHWSGQELRTNNWLLSTDNSTSTYHLYTDLDARYLPSHAVFIHHELNFFWVSLVVVSSSPLLLPPLVVLDASYQFETSCFTPDVWIIHDLAEEHRLTTVQEDLEKLPGSLTYMGSTTNYLLYH